MPLDLYLHQLSLIAYNRNKDLYKLTWAGKHPTHKTRIGHLLFWKTLSEAALGELEPKDAIKQKVEERLYNINIDPNTGRNKPKLSQINIYTDGSKTQLGTGGGFVIMKGRQTLIHTNSINLRPEASIFQAELTAITAATQSIDDRNQNRRHEIYKNLHRLPSCINGA